MANSQGRYDTFPSTLYDKFRWRDFRCIPDDKFSGNEHNCDCESSNLENSIEKSPRNRIRISNTSPTRSNKFGEIDTISRNRKKNQDHDTEKPEQLSRNAREFSLCDQPRKREKSYKKTKTKLYSPNVMQVKSVEVIKSWSMERCKAKYPPKHEEKPSGRNRRKRKILRKRKQIRRRYSETSISSVDSSSFHEKLIIPSVSPHNKVNKKISQSRKVADEQKLRVEKCPCCDCMIEGTKSPRVSTYPKYNRRREKSHERVCRQLESLRSLEDFTKKRGKMHKIKGKCQMESRSPESTCKTQKLCRMLKTREAKRFMGCCCVENDGRKNPVVKCQCPECPCDLNVTNKREYLLHTQDKDPEHIICDDNEICPSELNPLIRCNCEFSQVKNKNRIMKIKSDSQRNTAPDDPVSSQYNHCNVNQTKKKNVFTNKYVTQNVVNKTISANLPSSRNNTGISLIRTKGISTCCGTETVDQFIQCESQSILSNHVSKKCNVNEDLVEAVTSLREKLIRINPEIEPHYCCRIPHNTCRIDQCNCEPITPLSREKIASSPTIQRSNKKKSKSRFKQHRFVFPKIVKAESPNANHDVPKMFVYSTNDKNESRLSLYKTGSFVKCAIKRNNNIGNKYYITYIQKYVSKAWKTDDDFEYEIKSTECLSSDDYG